MEDDPAASFFAREEEELGDIRNDLGFEEITEPGNEDFDGGYGKFASEENNFYEPKVDYNRIIEEPEKMKIWRKEFQDRIETKDLKEKEARSELEKQAKKELEDWYKHHDQQQDKRFGVNRDHQKAFISQRDETIPGAEWERVCRLCDFNSKVTKSSKDTTRLRGMLLQLKQSPPTR